MKRISLAFIGAGNMAEALISRLAGYQILASDVRKERLEYLRKKYKIKICQNNAQAFNFGRVVILAIKPQNMSEVLEEIGRQNLLGRRQRKLIISIAAGIPLKYLEKKIPGYPIVRAMPNNPCIVGQGITALAKGRLVRGSDFERVKKIFRSVGEVVGISERLMDAVTGLSGSGPAFVYQTIEALIEGGIASGLSREMAGKLALQTVLGAVLVMKSTGKSARDLTTMVASPGGTTIEGLEIMRKSGFVRILKKAVVAATRKSKFLSRKWAR